MFDNANFLVFRLGDQRYALSLDTVERIIHAVEVSALPGAPPVVEGVINLHGNILPVLSLRRRLRMEDRVIRPENQFLIVRTSSRVVALVVDEADDVIAHPESNMTPSEGILPGLQYISGVLRLSDGLLFVYDLDSFLSPSESQDLEEALKQEGTHEQ